MKNFYRIISFIVISFLYLLSFSFTCNADSYPFHIDLDALTGPPVSRLNIKIDEAYAIHVNGSHFYTVGPDLCPGTLDDKRVRFWGVNLEAPLIFPRNRTEAENLALRLRKLGFNLVRVHGLDYKTFDQDKTLLSLDSNASYPMLYKNNLKAFDLLLDALGEQGIYVDLVLKVGYVFDSSKDCYFEADGNKRCVPDPSITTQRYPVPGVIPQASKPLDLFNHEMIELQKSYVTNVLERYGNRSELALIEINNENSLIERYWSSVDVFPPLYAEELDNLWNNWLHEKYRDTAALREAWKPSKKYGLRENLLSNGGFDSHSNNKTIGWELHQINRKKYGDWLVTDKKELELTIDEIPGKSWHFFLGYAGISIIEGETYRLDFTAYADEKRQIMVSLQGLAKHNGAMAFPGKNYFNVDDNKKRFSLCFTSVISDTNARLTFLPITPGGGKGKLWLDDISLTVAESDGLKNNESFQSDGTGNIQRPDNSIEGGCPGSKQKREDYLNFLSDTERRYYKEMLSLIRNKLKIKKPVTGTQANYGGLMSQNNMAGLMDYIDSHYYWDHPHIETKGKYRWWMKNSPMVENPSISIVSRIAETRVYGKPFTISEYSPNQMNLYAGEGHLITAAYAAFQDIDGVILFTYFTSGGDIRDKQNPKQLLHMYNLLGDTRSESLMHFAANLFRRGDVRVASSELNVRVNKKLMMDHGLKSRNIRGILETLENDDYIIGADGYGFNVLSGLRSKLGLIHTEDSDKVEQNSSYMYKDTIRNISDTGELMWYKSKIGEKSYFMLDTPLSQAVTGYIGKEIKLAGLVVTGKGDHDQFGTVSVTSIDGNALTKSTEFLITSVGKGKNRNLDLVSEGGGVTLCVVGKNGNCKKPFWHPDSGEFVVESNPVVMRFTSNAKKITVNQLDQKGRVAREIVVDKTSTGYEFFIGGDTSSYHSPWYVVKLIY